MIDGGLVENKKFKRKTSRYNRKVRRRKKKRPGESPCCLWPCGQRWTAGSCCLAAVVVAWWAAACCSCMRANRYCWFSLGGTRTLLGGLTFRIGFFLNSSMMATVVSWLLRDDVAAAVVVTSSPTVVVVGGWRVDATAAACCIILASRSVGEMPPYG